MKNGVATSIVDGITLFKMIPHMPTPIEDMLNFATQCDDLV